MPAPKTSRAEPAEERQIETFSIAVPWLKKTDELRLDASFYNPRVAEALAVLRRSGMALKPLRGQPKIIESIPTRYWSRSSALQPVV